MRPGLFAFPRHHDCIDEIKRLQPSCVKAFASVTSNDWWKSVKQVAPNAICVLVHGEISDNKTDLSNPEGDADATAAYLADKPDCPRLVICKNEYSIWDGATARAKWVAYMLKWVARMHAHGINVVVGEFNSGWPKVSVLDSEDWWPDFAAVDAVLNDGDYWGLHTYWGKDGPIEWWPWTVGRHLRCPTTHNILIDECGYDGNTDGLGYNQGWGNNIAQAVYVQQIVDFHRMLNCDPRVKGTSLFVVDYDSSEWAQFDCYPLMNDLIARAAECDSTHAWVTMPSALVVPVAGYVRISQTYAEHAKANPTGGAWGLDFSCYVGTAVMAADSGTVDKIIDYGTSSYGLMVQINHGWGFTRYGHLSAVSVSKGDSVDPGQVIALSGNTGNSTGPHLHFEVIPFTNRTWPYRIDPEPLLFEDEEEEPDGMLTEAQKDTVRNLAWNKRGFAYNSTFALARAAAEANAGAPITPEEDVVIGSTTYRWQFFTNGIAIAPMGKWEEAEVVDWGEEG